LGNVSVAAIYAWTIVVDTTAPPAPSITDKPNNPTNQTTASFSFGDAEAGVSFLCKLDGGVFTECTSPASYPGLSQASHTFSVKAQDGAGNQSAATTFTWTVDTTPPPVPAIAAKPAILTNQTSATFTFTDTQAGVTFLCQQDGSAFSACAASPSCVSWTAAH
jgi:large repetitive protein